MIRGPGLLLLPASTASTTIITSNYSGLRVHRGLYKRKPSSVHMGFDSYSVVFENYTGLTRLTAGEGVVGALNTFNAIVKGKGNVNKRLKCSTTFML